MKSRSWRLWIFGGLALLFIAICVGIFIWAIHQFGWDWIGFNGGYSQITIHRGSQDIVLPQAKTLWDWLQLLIVPAILAAGAGFFTWWSGRTEQHIAQQRYEQDQRLALEKQREDLLQSYLDRMADLLLDKHLRDSQADAEVRKVARTRTVSTLIQLDSKRARTVLLFLNEAQLREASDSVISLENADLSSAKWSQGNLSGFNLSKANLSKADLSKTDLSIANLREADLSRADLSRAKLLGADLREADLSRADLSGADLRYAKLSGADFREVNLSGADLFRADLSGAKLNKADLSGAILIGAKLNEATLSEATLRIANLNLADLSKAKLFGVDFFRATLNETNLSGADLRWVNLGLADLKGAGLKGAKLDSVQFLEAAFLDNTDLRGVEGLTSKQLADCKTRGAIVDKEGTHVAPPLSSAALTLSQETAPPTLPSPEHLAEEQKTSLDATSSQKQAAVEQKAVLPMPLSPSQENTSLTQGSTTTPSSSQDAAP